eukprot:4771939-Pyramimonas_sp.AAC.1
MLYKGDPHQGYSTNGVIPLEPPRPTIPRCLLFLGDHALTTVCLSAVSLFGPWGRYGHPLQRREMSRRSSISRRLSTTRVSRRRAPSLRAAPLTTATKAGASPSEVAPVRIRNRGPVKRSNGCHRTDYIVREV